jgi:hypothetical protein
MGFRLVLYDVTHNLTVQSVAEMNRDERRRSSLANIITIQYHDIWLLSSDCPLIIRPFNKLFGVVVNHVLDERNFVATTTREPYTLHSLLSLSWGATVLSYFSFAS